ncbi:MAG: hypothetical protein HQL84_13485 [Magnetococcales bacterium]|nr:hypothetical protein [Magnetococcales bacterium]MBF0151046.1 hypothetical protein [Magnetococcales bacterium]MBF0346230.1 hypothetical protein [Magnetococcales bacterium]
MGYTEMINVSRCRSFKLADSWKIHRKACKLPDMPIASGHMLFFYAVECGLKHLIIDTKKMKSCSNTKSDPLFSHDLFKILKTLKPARSEIGLPPDQLRLTTPKSEHENFFDVHLAWRYGLEIDQKNEKEIMDWLQQVDKFLFRKIGKA